MLIVLTSAKGSPGVTASTLALTAAAASAPRTALLLEADLAGGDLECWCGPFGASGLLDVAEELRRGVSPHDLWPQAVEIVPGVPGVIGPTTARTMTAALGGIDHPLANMLSRQSAMVLVDTGRWTSHGTVGVAASADLLLAVCQPTLASIEHTRELVEVLRGVSPYVAALVVGGERPYGPDEVAVGLGVPVVGVLPNDLRGLSALITSGVGKSWHRSLLSHASDDALNGICGTVGWLSTSV